MGAPLDEHQIEAILKRLRQLRADEGVLVRAKNIVMARVRADTSQVQLKLSLERTRLSFGQLLALRPRAIVAFIVALAVLLGGGGTVAAAQNDLPGDTLYEVKLASEAVAAVVLPSKEAKLKFAAKRAERRGVEISALAQKVQASAPEKKAELNRSMEKVAERLRHQARELQVQVAQFEQSASPAALGMLTTTTEVHATLKAVQGVLAEIAASGQLSAELKAKAVSVEIVLEALETKAAAVESTVLKRHASKVGLEGAAAGRVRAASHKLNAVTQLRARIIKDIAEVGDSERGIIMKKEFEHRDEFYRDAVAALEDAQEALKDNQWDKAIEKANQALKLLIQFMSPLAHELKLPHKVKPLMEMMESAADEDADEDTDEDTVSASEAMEVPEKAQVPHLPLPVIPVQVTLDKAEHAGQEARAIVETYKEQLDAAVREKIQFLALKADANLAAGKYLEAHNLYVQIMIMVKASMSTR